MKKYKDTYIIKRLFSYLKEYKAKLILCLVYLIFSVIADLAIPYIMGEVIKILQKDVIIYSNICYLSLFACLVLSLALFSQYFLAINLQKIGQGVIMNLRNEIYYKILSLSHEQFNMIQVGKFVTRVTSDPEAILNLFTNVLTNLIKNIFTLIGVIIVMGILNKTLLLYVLITFPFILGFSIIFRYYSRKAYRKVRNSISNMNAFLSENLSGMKIIQVFNQEEKKKNEFNLKNNEMLKNGYNEILVFGIFRPAIYVLYLVSLALVIYIGCKENLSGNIYIDASMIFTFTQYVGRFFNPIQQLAEQFNVIQSSFAAAERIFEVLDTKPTIVDEEDAIILDHINGDIEFKNVYFSYIKDEYVLKNVSFKVNAKESIAFVGATGSGKTTILSLIVRNYDIDSGSILIDGIDIKKIKISCLRKHFGQMLQDVFLFSGTIKSNIRLEDETITDEKIVEACKYVHADSFILKLENKYDEVVKERGNNFSQGQRQLLSFARTVAHSPSVIILDEATANIDTETEKLIQESLSKMLNIGTTLIVAHRLSTIQHCNKIIVMKKGHIIEIGNHQELLKQKGHYYNLYKLQYEQK